MVSDETIDPWPLLLISRAQTVTNHRSHDDGLYLSGVSDRYAVMCPSCGARAVVYSGEPRLVCDRCGHCRIGQGGGWQGKARAEVRKTCGRCRHVISKSFERVPPRPRRVDVTCPSCGSVYDLTLHWWPIESGSGARDPHFGCELWYTTSCTGELLWAINDRHLEFLETYLSASLRSRQPNINRSLASRLPAWMTSTKNRAEVLKCIARLKAKGAT